MTNLQPSPKIQLKFGLPCREITESNILSEITPRRIIRYLFDFSIKISYNNLEVTYEFFL